MPATHRRRTHAILAVAASAMGICAAAAAAEFDESQTTNAASGTTGLISFQCAKPAGAGTFVSMSFAAIHQATVCFTAQHSHAHHVTIDWGDTSSLYSADVDATEGEQICLPTSSRSAKIYFGEGDVMPRAWINDVLVYKGLVNLHKDASGCNVQDLYNVESLDEIATYMLTATPTDLPSAAPVTSPPTASPTTTVSANPSASPTPVPTATPTDLPSAAPTTSPPTALPTVMASANPSASPTPGSGPTEHPTTAMFADRSNDFAELIYFSPEIVGPGWAAILMGPFGKCAGDCDNDDDCRPGLVCFQRSGFEDATVPGCAGTVEEDVDYCYDPSYQYPSAAPSPGPSASPTSSPSQPPTVTSSAAPSIALSSLPSSIPTITSSSSPSVALSGAPSSSPTASPVTLNPTASPTATPTSTPSKNPTPSPVSPAPTTAPSGVIASPTVAPVVSTETPVVPVIENNADGTEEAPVPVPVPETSTAAPVTSEASTTCGIDIDTKCFFYEPNQIEAIDCREVTGTAHSSGELLNVTWSYTLTNTCQDDWTIIARQNLQSCKLCPGSGLQCERVVNFFQPDEDNCVVLDNTGRYLGFPPGCSITENVFNEIKVGSEDTGRCLYNKEVNLRVIEGASTKPVALKYSFVAPMPFGNVTGNAPP